MLEHKANVRVFNAKCLEIKKGLGCVDLGLRISSTCLAPSRITSPLATLL